MRKQNTRINTQSTTKREIMNPNGTNRKQYNRKRTNDTTSIQPQDNTNKATKTSKNPHKTTQHNTRNKRNHKSQSNNTTHT